MIAISIAFAVQPRPVRAGRFITLASTTSVQDSGLLAHIIPLFRQATGVDVQVIAVGSGQALDAARNGEADLALVHDPAAEQQFINEWHVSAVREIAWNDFVIVGPSADPAVIKDGHDARGAFKAIWKEQAPFVSRGDRSGTDSMEKLQWHLAGLDVTKAGAWYRVIGGSMAAALTVAANIGGYTLSDRGTWLSFNEPRSLIILVEGDKYLINRYDVIELNRERHSQAKLDLAHQFADWLASPIGQEAIGSYQVDGHTLFHPESDPKPKGVVGGR